MRGNDDTAFFAASIEETRTLAGSAVIAQTTDANGPLTPGRWLAQIVGASDPTAIVWLIAVPHVAGETLAATAGVGKKRFPLGASGMNAVEFNVVKGYNDRIAVITSVGTVTLYLSRVSRSA